MTCLVFHVYHYLTLVIIAFHVSSIMAFFLVLYMIELFRVLVYQVRFFIGARTRTSAGTFDSQRQGNEVGL